MRSPKVQIEQDNNRNPVTIVTALNELKRLGRSGALDALQRAEKEEFTLLGNVEIVVQLLFEQKDTNEKFPSRDLKEGTDYELVRDDWLSDFEIVDGIPFATNLFPVTHNGVVYRRTYLFKWANERGRFNHKPLIPTNDPFKSSAELIQKTIAATIKQNSDCDQEFLDAIPERITNRIQDQVYEMVKHLVPKVERPEIGEWAKRPDLWRELQIECLNKGLQWSSSSNRYIFTR